MGAATAAGETAHVDPVRHAVGGFARSRSLRARARRSQQDLELGLEARPRGSAAGLHGAWRRGSPHAANGVLSRPANVARRVAELEAPATRGGRRHAKGESGQDRWQPATNAIAGSGAPDRRRHRLKTRVCVGRSGPARRLLWLAASRRLLAASTSPAGRSRPNPGRPVRPSDGSSPERGHRTATDVPRLDVAAHLLVTADLTRRPGAGSADSSATCSSSRQARQARATAAAPL